MAKTKMKFTKAQKMAREKAKAEREKKYKWIFMNGKQVRVKRPPTIEGLEVDEFIRQNADPIWIDRVSEANHDLSLFVGCKTIYVNNS